VREEWEGVARAIHEGTGLDEPPVSAFELAAMCGLSLQPSPRHGASLRPGLIVFESAARPERQHGIVAHELGHWGLVAHGVRDSEEGARYLAGALLLPRAGFDRDLRKSWDLRRLRAKHLNASAQMVATRIVQLRDAVATVVDQGRVTSRLWSPWLADPRIQRFSRWERSLADAALASGETVIGDEFCYAVPVLDGPYRRVIVVCEASQLALRF
jgi:hypothetical protein